MERDLTYREKRDRIQAFEFDHKVAQVFDDMVSRSVPHYHYVHTMMAEVLAKFLRPQDLIYDLGCSTGSTIQYLAECFPTLNLQFIGIDNSHPMLEKCREKLQGLPDIELLCTDIDELDFRPCRAVIMNYTLQFVPLGKRPLILQKIYRSLKPGGLFFLSEKIKSVDPVIEELLTTLYYDFKRQNGYTELEIAQKKEALEKRLIPLTQSEQLHQLKACGFDHVASPFRWNNFCSYVGIKA